MRTRSDARAFLASWWAALLVATASAVLVLGPALSPGLVQAYDLSWSPVPRWTPHVLGLDAPAPRVVPSDAVAVAIGTVLGAQVTQKAILLGLLLAAALGGVRLLRIWSSGRPGAAATTTVILLLHWNPFVAQRLIIGQWTILLGYALAPWALVAVLRLSRNGRVWPVAAVSVVAGLGGANTWLMVLLVLVPTVPYAAARASGARGAVRACLVLSCVAAGSAACWALPALAADPGRTPGAEEFAARSDSPFGVAGSLLSGGGIWNTFAQGAQRRDLLSAGLVLVLMSAALIALGVAVRRGDRVPRLLALGGLPGLLLAGVSGWAAARPVWSAFVEGVPGAAVMRDSQKLIAPWVVVAVIALGHTVSLAVRRRPALISVAWGVALLPVPLTMSMVWGFHGRLDAVPVPNDITVTATRLSEAAPGEVAVLPWGQYRRYAWNGARVSVSVVPRLVDQPVLAADSLPLSSGTVPGESPRAAAVEARLRAGVDPVAAVRAEGVRYVWWEGPPSRPPQIPADARVLARSANLVLLELPGSRPSPAVTHPRVRVVGAVVSAGTALLVLGVAGLRRRPRSTPFDEGR